jgi:hypothetical protein
MIYFIYSLKKKYCLENKMDRVELDISKTLFYRLISLLERRGKRAMIEELYEAMDEEYVPPHRRKYDLLSDDEGSAEEEEGYEVYIDQHGFQSLK